MGIDIVVFLIIVALYCALLGVLKFITYNNFHYIENINYMKTIKNVAITIGIAAAYSLVLYAAISFYHLSFNASKWTEGSRMWISAGVPIICIISAIIVGVVAEEKKEAGK